VAFSQRVTDRVQLQNSDLVFVGYGVTAPEYDWDDFKDVDVTGKTIVVLVNDPQIPDANDPSRLDDSCSTAEAMTYYGRWTYKYEEAARRGAAGVFIVHETEPAGYPFPVVQGFLGERFDLVADDKNMGRAAIQGWFSLDTTRALFKMAGQDFDALKKQALTRDFRPVPLNLQASMALRQTMRTLESRNVIAKLEGSDPQLRDEYVVYTAHWDHLGMGEPDETGDRIFSGALDNASGVASLLEIARGIHAGFSRSRSARSSS
jgi:Zn-dependent M28 family amino/carboxypeptidase